MTQQFFHNREAMERIAFEGLNGFAADYAQHLNLAEIWAVEEDILSLYLQGDFEGEGFRGNLGVRYVSTEQSSGGYEFSGETWGLATVVSKLDPSSPDYLTPEILEWRTHRQRLQRSAAKHEPGI